MITERSFGALPLFLNKEKWQVFLVQLKSGHHWSIPKGHKEEGESSKDTARRELFEETGLIPKRWIEHDKLIEKYQLTRDNLLVDKEVEYFICEVTSPKVKLQEKELIDGRWVDIENAKEHLTYRASKEIMSTVNKWIKEKKLCI